MIAALDGRGGCTDTVPNSGRQSVHPVVDHLTLDFEAEIPRPGRNSVDKLQNNI